MAAHAEQLLLLHHTSAAYVADVVSTQHIEKLVR